MIVGSKEYMIEKYGQETVESWLENVEMENLWGCRYAFSNNSFVGYELHHREKDLNILEMILQETPNALYKDVTYGVSPNTICTEEIGYLTGRTYGNLDIAIFLIQEKIKELKAWVLENHNFTEREIRLLHYDVKGDLDAKD